MSPTPFERDMAAQPEALRELAEAPLPGLGRLDPDAGERIVLTGMGSSHFAGLPTWRALVAQGRAAWAVDTGRLLDSPGVLTPDTLLIVTSQSGASGEVVRLLERLSKAGRRPRTVLGITADDDSPLAGAADILIPLRSGAEATVSTKSYLNTLAAHRRLVAVFAGESDERARAEIAASAEDVARTLEVSGAEAIARAALADAGARLAAIGTGDSAATALYAALITKEAAKLPIEGYVGGQFRHGPYELAGPGLTAFIYGAVSQGEGSLRSLATDLVASGSRVVTIGDDSVADATGLGAVPGGGLRELVAGAVVAQLLAVGLATANRVTPGEFVFGSKVTTAL